MDILCSRTTAVVKSMRQSCLTRIWTEWGLQSLYRSAKKLCATVTVRTVHGEEINATPPLTLYVILKRRKHLLNLLAQAKGILLRSPHPTGASCIACLRRHPCTCYTAVIFTVVYRRKPRIQQGIQTTFHSMFSPARMENLDNSVHGCCVCSRNTSVLCLVHVPRHILSLILGAPTKVVCSCGGVSGMPNGFLLGLRLICLFASLPSIFLATRHAHTMLPHRTYAPYTAVLCGHKLRYLYPRGISRHCSTSTFLGSLPETSSKGVNTFQPIQAHAPVIFPNFRWPKQRTTTG